jgi:methionyl-tRNA synthetase
MNLPETRDADFTWSDFQARTNNELAAIVGNYANRVLAFIARNFDGRVPMLDAADADIPEWWRRVVADAVAAAPEERARVLSAAADRFSAEERAMIAALVTGADAVAANYRAFRFRDAVSETIAIARAANKFFNDAAPWKSLTEDPARCARTLYTCLQVLRAIGVAIAPVAPNLGERIQRLCGAEHPATGAASDGEAGDNVWVTIPLPTIEQGTPVGPAERLIEQITDEQIAAERAKLGTVAASTPAPTDESRITIEEFGRIELRTARILSAERVPKSQKLVKLIVDLGTEQRQIVAGIGKHYAPENLVGLDVVVVANLQPARLMGVESQGMLLAANSGEQLVLVSPRGQVPPGSVVR